MLHEIKTKKLLAENVEALRNAILCSKVFLPPDISKFVFLCGANKNPSEISERRKALINFARKNIPNTHFFLAEKVLSTLQKEKNNENLLDIENVISDFSDYILIILESPSAYTELGAFSHKILREKLIVINNSKFKTEESFINLGPIRAIEEAAGKNRIVYYKMSEDGILYPDGISDTFYKIYSLLQEPIKSTRASKIKISIDEINPSINNNKKSAMFIHDLIYLSGPLLHKEIIELLKLIFGDNSYNYVVHLLAILSSFGAIQRDSKDSLFRSKLDKTYYNFSFDLSSYIATFRNYMLKNYPERLYAH